MRHLEINIDKVFSTTFYCSLFMFLFSVQTIDAQRNSGLWLNEVPLVADSSTHKLYVPIEPAQAYALKGCLRWENKGTKVSLNGTALTSNIAGNFQINDWRKESQNILKVNDLEWKLIFTTLPVLLLEADQKDLYEVYKKDEKQKSPAFIQVIDPRARTKDLKQQYIEFSSPCRMRVRGATSAGKEKKSFAISLVDELGEEKSAHLLGLRDDDDWILDAQFNDYAKMRNRLITDLWTSVDKLPYEIDNEFQMNGTQGEFVEVFMKGAYWGLYCFTDKIDRKKLNLKKTKEATATSKEEIRGLLWKSTFQTSATTFTGYGERPSNNSLIWEKYWEQKYPDDREDQANFTPIANMIDHLKANEKSEKICDAIEENFYIDNAIDYLLFTQAFQLMDNLQKNFYLSVRNLPKDQPQRLLITLWDLDASIGRDAGGDPLTDDKQWLAFGSKLEGTNYLIWHLANPNYQTKEIRNRIYNRWQYLKTHELSLMNIQKRMEQYGELFNRSGAWKRELELSTALRAKVNKKPKQAATPEEEINYMMNFLTLNYQKMDETIDKWGADPYNTEDYEASQAKQCLYIVEQDTLSRHEENTTIVPGKVNSEEVGNISSIAYEDNLMKISHVDNGDATYFIKDIKEVKTSTENLYPTYAFLPSSVRAKLDFDTHFSPAVTSESLHTGDFGIQRTLQVKFEKETTKVIGNTKDIKVTIDKGNAIIETMLEGVCIEVSGSSNIGSLMLKNSQPMLLTGNAHLVYDAPCDEKTNNEKTLIASTGKLVVAADLSLFSTAYNGRALQAEDLVLRDGNIDIILTGSGTLTDAEFITRPEAGARAIYGKKVTVEGGIIRIKTMGDNGAVGIAGIDKITVKGGELYAACYDDPMKAGASIVISGGKVITSSTTNDGMDSKGGFTIQGGTIQSYSPEGAEGSFDCDGKNFTISGGTLIGIGCKGDAIIANKSTQPSFRIYKNKSLKQTLRIVDTKGTPIIEDIETPKFEKDPTKTLVFSHPKLVKGEMYQILTSEDCKNFSLVTEVKAE